MMLFRVSTFLLVLTPSSAFKCACSGNSHGFTGANTHGGRRIEGEPLPEEAFNLCYSVGDKLTTMLTKALQIFVEKNRSNSGEITSIMRDVYDWCADAPNEDNNLDEQDVVQCQGYASLLLEIYETSGEMHPAEQMLLSAFGSNDEKKDSCGVLINQLNSAIKEHHFQDVSVIEAVDAPKFNMTTTTGVEVVTDYPPFHPDGSTADVVVAKTHERAMALGPIAASMGVLVSTAVGTAYYLFELCHDFDGKYLLA